MYAKLALYSLALLLPVVASAADGHTNHHIQGLRVDVHGVFGGYASLGAGIRFDIPIVKNGFLNNVDDEFALSPGVDVLLTDFYPDYYHGGPYFIPSLVAQWNFYLGDKWSIFPEAGVAMYVGNEEFMRHGVHGYYFVPDLGFGGRYHFTNRNSLIGRVSYPTGLQFGVTF